VKFKFYLELGSRTQDKGGLDLLRFPMLTAFAEGQSWSAQWWSGRTRRNRGTERDTVLQSVAAKGANELQLQCRTHPTKEPTAKDVRVTGASIWFTPSPTSDVWAEVPSTPAKSHIDERNRLSFGGGRSFVQEFHNKYQLPYPSVAEYSLELECAAQIADEFALQEMAISLLRASFPAALAQSNIFGYGCVHGGCRKQMMLHSLGGVPAWIDELGEKFENVYPILVGPRHSCEGFASVIGDGCSVTSIANGSPVGVLSISPAKIEEVRHDPKAKEWVVMRDLSKLGGSPATVEELYRKEKSVPWVAPFVKT